MSSLSILRGRSSAAGATYGKRSVKMTPISNLLLTSAVDIVFKLNNRVDGIAAVGLH